MTIKRVLAAFALLLAFSSAHASMIWTAVALSTKQLDAIAKDEGLLEKTLENSTGKQSMDLDKAWHGIHFLLNGTAWSITTVAGEAILGGREFGPDMGYGRPKLISADKVKQIATALANVTATELSSRYHPEAMEKAEIYPSIWKQEGPQALPYLLNGYSALLAFYQRAAERGESIVIVIL
jgi:hypothetical protein